MAKMAEALGGKLELDIVFRRTVYPP